MTEPYGGYTQAEIAERLEWSWAYSFHGMRLHHVAEIDGPASNGRMGVTGRTSCGRRGEWLMPGLSFRLGLTRCAQCCDRLGLPHGRGSPLNDGELRPLVEARMEACLTAS